MGTVPPRSCWWMVSASAMISSNSPRLSSRAGGRYRSSTPPWSGSQQAQNGGFRNKQRGDAKPLHEGVQMTAGRRAAQSSTLCHTQTPQMLQQLCRNHKQEATRRTSSGCSTSPLPGAWSGKPTGGPVGGALWSIAAASRLGGRVRGRSSQVVARAWKVTAAKARGSMRRA